MAGERIEYLDQMRAVAIVMVVCIHAVGYVPAMSPLQLDWVLFWVLPIAVPVFFFVDGFLLSMQLDTKPVAYGPYIRKSAIRLLIPWVLFSIFYAVARYVLEMVGFLSAHLVLGQEPQQVAARVYMSVYAPQMYFLLSLFLIRAALPVIRRLFHDASLHLAIAMAIGVIVFYNMVDVEALLPFHDLLAMEGQEPVLHAIFGLQFFALGMVMSRLRMHTDFRRWVLPLAILFVASSVMKVMLPGNHWWTAFFYLILFFVLFSEFSRESKLLRIVGQNTMGIYLLHTPIVLRFVTMVVALVVAEPMTAFLLSVCGVMVVSLALSLLVTRVPYGGMLFGIPRSVRA